jgi:peptide/nickel transport system ATP-binding protein
MSAPKLLEVEGLGVRLTRPDGRPLRLLDDVSFSLDRSETLGITGESGSGKTLLGLALIGLLPPGAGVDGSIRMDGEELTHLDDDARSAWRGRRMAMVFQEPLTALNPAMRIGDQIAEALACHRLAEGESGRRRAVGLLDRVRLADAGRRAGAYPHELSGGERQRVLIAMALAAEPDLLIADEPTTAIDASVSGEILDLFAELVRGGMALLLISHDLGVVARACRRLMVFYAGTRFEAGPTGQVLGAPTNPYTEALAEARPRRRHHPADRLATIAGAVPSPDERLDGCRFAPRCRHAEADCRAGEPGWTELDDIRGVRCRHPLAGKAPA